MKSKIMRALVTSVANVSPTLKKITFRLSQGLNYEPGQSVRIGGKLYALCSCPEEAVRTNSYEILVEKQPLGSPKEEIELMREGDFLKVEGPFGEFFPLRAQPFEEIVWLATPSQLGGFLSSIRSKKFLRLRPIKILLIVEVTDEREFPFRELFEANGVSVITCVTQPFHWVEGFWGKMSDFVKSKRLNLDFHRSRFFLGVDESMAEGLTRALLDERRVASSRVEVLNPPQHEPESQPQMAQVIPFERKKREVFQFLKAA